MTITHAGQFGACVGFDSRLCRGNFSGSSHTSGINMGTPMATLSGVWRYRVSAGTGWPSVMILRLGEVESLICSFYFSVAARKLVLADPSLRYSSMLLGTTSNQHTEQNTGRYVNPIYLSNWSKSSGKMAEMSEAIAT